MPAVAGIIAVVLAGCGDQRSGDNQSSQVAAKVNKEELSVHQVSFMVQQMRGIRPEQLAAASRQMLERLIDQELAVQRAQELKVDREPEVIQQIEASRREIISRAFGERIGQAAEKPTDEEIAAYYNAHPALFRERRVYSLQELQIEAPPAQHEELRGQLGAATNVAEFVEYLRSADIRFRAVNAVRSAEQLPMISLDAYARLKPGESLFNATPTGVQVVVLLDARSQPVDQEKARPAIEQFLLTERRRKLVDEELRKLRDAAKIEYLGAFAESVASAAHLLQRGEPAPLPTAVVLPVPVPARPALAASVPDADTINSDMELKR